jgi:hypothetical protein
MEALRRLRRGVDPTRSDSPNVTTSGIMWWDIARAAVFLASDEAS